MPFKDPEKEKEYRREQARQRRAQAKQPKPAVDNLPMAADVFSSSDIPGQQAPTVLAKTTPPAPATQPETIIYRIFNRVTKIFWDGHASSPQAACDKVPWRIEDCWVRHESGKGGWNNDTPQFVPGVKSLSLDNPQSRAEDVAARTRELLDTRGWVKWKCDLFHGDTILVLLDESVKDYPPGYPIWLEDELKNLPESDSALQFIHRIKKEALAQILPGFEKVFNRH